MSLIAEYVAGYYVAFEQIDATGMIVGQQITDAVLGNNFTLCNSGSTVDHVTVEAVKGRPKLRWLISPSIDDLAAALATSTAPLSQTFISDIVDLTQTNAGGTTVVIPAKPGFFPLSITQRAMIVTKGGTLSTQPTFSMGADASYIDFAASAAVNFSVGFAAGVGSSVAFSSQASPVATYSHTTPVYLKQTVAAAGSGLVLTVRFVFSIVWVPAFS